MTLKEKLFGFEGRLRRRDYWLFGIGSVVAFYAVLMIVSLTVGGPSAPDEAPGLAVLLITLIAWIPLIWVNLALGIKRCHDRNQSGLWILIGLIPLLGALWTLVNLGILDGTPGENRFGASPKARPTEDVFA